MATYTINTTAKHEKVLDKLLTDGIQAFENEGDYVYTDKQSLIVAVLKFWFNNELAHLVRKYKETMSDEDIEDTILG